MTERENKKDLILRLGMGRGSCVVGGHDLADQVTALTLTRTVHGEVELNLTLPVSDTDVEIKDVQVIGPLREALLELGWTPPGPGPVPLTGPEKVQAAVRRDRGGNPPAQFRGFA